MTISSQIRYYQFFVELTPALILGIIQVLRNTDGMGVSDFPKNRYENVYDKKLLDL